MAASLDFSKHFKMQSTASSAQLIMKFDKYCSDASNVILESSHCKGFLFQFSDEIKMASNRNQHLLEMMLALEKRGFVPATEPDIRTSIESSIKGGQYAFVEVTQHSNYCTIQQTCSFRDKDMSGVLVCFPKLKC